MISGALLALLFSIATQTFPAPKVEAATLNKEELQAIAMANATAYHLSNEDIKEMLATIECESHWNIHSIGDGGNSYGLVQIYLPAHAEPMKNKEGKVVLSAVSGVEALNPFFSLEWMAKAFSLGKQHMWTCWRNLDKPVQVE